MRLVPSHSIFPMSMIVKDLATVKKLDTSYYFNIGRGLHA